MKTAEDTIFSFDFDTEQESKETNSTVFYKNLPITMEEKRAAFQKKGNELLAQLEKEILERNHTITNLSQSNKSLISTKVPAIDQLLHYMLHRSIQEGITFDVSLSGDVAYMTKEILTEKDCLTILADLLENAMIATKETDNKLIFLHIGVIEQCYSIDVWDSGMPFAKEVLYHLGKERYTTRKKHGGSGIGIMNTYELAKKYHASLELIEKQGKESFFNKKLSIVFDKKQQYRLSANRNTSELDYLSQRDDLIFL